MSRRIAREICMKLLFQMNIHNDFSSQVVNKYLEEEEVDVSQRPYIHKVIEAFINNKVAIDTIINEYSKGWTVNRIAKVDLSILRLALTEILYIEEIPYAVAINEAIEMAKKYSGDDSDNYINGLLDKFVEASGLKGNEES